MARKKEEIKVSFVDSYSALDVTGSSVYIQTPNHKILLDCGLHQSNDKKEDYLINSKKPKEFRVKDLDFIFVTHNHIDHIGKVPKMYKDGFRGATIIPSNTKSTFQRMCEDCGYINERDIELINNQENKKWSPLYTVEDVHDCMQYIIEKPINEKIKINEELEFMFVPSGHLFNSCQLLLWITVNNVTKCIGYTGDIGNTHLNNKYVGNLEQIKNCDILIAESTYGDRPDLKITTKERQNDLNKLKTIIDTQVIQMKGRLVIPVFAQCRCVQMLQFIYSLYKNEDFPYKIFIDSPLAIDLIEDLHNKLQDEELQEFENMLNWEKLELIRESEQSKSLVSSNQPCVILSTSGMMTTGRIRHHFKSIVSNPNSTILFCGYSTEGSLASLLKDPKNQTISIDGKEYKIKCASYSLKSMSGHAPFDVLLNYYSNVNCNKIILHHGSENAKITLSKYLKKELENKCKTTRVINANSSLKITI